MPAHLELCAIPEGPTASEAKVAIMYVCQLASKRGKLVPAKAKALGVPPCVPTLHDRGKNAVQPGATRTCPHSTCV